PLAIPEINGDLLQSQHRLISPPNCVASIMLMVLAPLHHHYQINRIYGSTYQAARAAGRRGLEELTCGQKSEIYPHSEQYNLVLYEASSEEEEKIVFESKKILQNEEIKINIRTVRVPVLRAHSVALNVSFEREPIDAEEILKT